MAENDFNMVKPVESLQNISGLSPAKRREEKKRRQNTSGQKKDNSEQQLAEFIEESELNGESVRGTQDVKNRQQDDAGIDYRA
ncbi:MAG: hypothetical protein NTW55_04220 [Planctomycetota bacterium]|nr:hypothetical protein [Planctomycetota bacterium]